MTRDPRRTDERLRELFHSARRAESDGAPSFSSMLRRGERVERPGHSRRRLLALGLGTAALATFAVLGATWLLVPTSSPLLVAERAPLERQAPLPVVLAPEPEAPEASAAAAPAQRQPTDRRSDEAAENERTATGGAAGDGGTATPQSPPPEPVVEHVEVLAAPETVELASTQTAKPADGPAESPPRSGRFFQKVLTPAPGVQDSDGDGDPNLEDARELAFRAMVSEVTNVDALTGQNPSASNPNSIGEMEGLTERITVRRGRAARKLARTASWTVQSETYEDDATEPWNAESYRSVEDNDFLAVTENPLSTFSIDVDTASYSNVRRFLTAGQLPPTDAVRIEELVNYFRYEYPQPTDGAPFAASVEIADCPWNAGHRLARIGIKAREIARGEHAGSNLVFLIDVSGSMQHRNKLPLLKKALGLLVEQLDGRDQVAIVVYAGSSGLVLPSTSGDAKTEILDALDRLRAGGSTNGGAGLRLAYRVARENFIPGGINRVILATDGDFNVGVTSHGELLRLIKKDADDGIFLTTLGFGYGNYQDDRLEHLADKGNGNHAYIDRLKEARKVLVEQLTGTLVTVAKDVKIQVEFNPLEVGAYRLIGYENRMLKKEDFHDDRKDAGEIGAGHTVTALYELVPPQAAADLPRVDELRYRAPASPSDEARSGEALTLKLRYKEPEGKTSRLLSFPVVDQGHGLRGASADFKFAAAVAQFGMLLRHSEHRGTASFDAVRELALEGAGVDEGGYRAEFLDLVRRAEALAKKAPGS